MSSDAGQRPLQQRSPLPNNNSGQMLWNLTCSHAVASSLFLEVIGTGALILCILAITDKKNIGAPRGMEPLCIGLVIMAIAVSMGLNCGYPINPARDLGPRFFTAVAGWGMGVFR